MRSGRMEAFSDGVLAIVITIMVLELPKPGGGAWHDLGGHVLPALLTYLLSYAYVGIYWNNHHHMLAATDKVDGLVLWANLHLLFWLSLVPWTTKWLGETDFDRVPTAVYGISLLTAAIAYFVLQTAIIRVQGPGSILATAIGGDWKGKTSPFVYAAGVALALVGLQIVSIGLYAVVALMWIVPDRRVEARLTAPAE